MFQLPSATCVYWSSHHTTLEMIWWNS
jgi:hypothetical protein